MKWIHFYCDITDAIHRCFAGTPGKAQSCSRRFRKAVLEIADSLPNSKFELAWCPDHPDVTGNERADELAAFGSTKPPANPLYRSMSCAGARMRGSQLKQWEAEWKNTPRNRRSH